MTAPTVRRLLDVAPPVRLADLFDGWNQLLTRPCPPDLDTVAELSFSTWGRGSISVHVDEHRAFLQWAEFLGLAFRRAGDGLLAAAGPVDTGRRHLLVRVLYALLPEGITT